MPTHYIAIFEDAGPDKAVGVWFPDLPGCFSAGDTFDDALANAPEAAALWLEALDAGTPWPRMRSLSELKADPDVTADLKNYGDNVVFVAIPVPARPLAAAE